MTAASNFDLGPLTWVKGEIDLALERADEALREYAASGDATHLKFCRNHGQGTMDLMHMGATELELGDVCFGEVLAESLFRPFQRQVNLTLDPGQGAQIEFSCRVHSLSRSMLVNPP